MNKLMKKSEQLDLEASKLENDNEASFLSEIRCGDNIQMVIIFEVQLSPTTWEQFGYDLNVKEKKTDCITHWYNDKPELLWRKIITRA